MNKQTKLLIFIFCIVKLSLHLIADSHSGFQGDELLHIETGKHLAFGYMEFPPLIGLLAFIQNISGSNQVYVQHFFSHIATILIIIYVAKTTIESGGKNKAIFLALLCVDVLNRKFCNCKSRSQTHNLKAIIPIGCIPILYVIKKLNIFTFPKSNTAFPMLSIKSNDDNP